MNITTEPALAPPGAGLPSPELFIGRLLLAFRCLTATRESLNARLHQERAAILALVERCGPEACEDRVLIKRLPGLEDSSRYWSVWMTLDHLRIVHLAMSGIIRSLSQGEMPEGAASTAAVKPSPAATAAVMAEYEASCETLLATVAAAPNLKTPLRYAHPWFGPLNAASWHALAAGHLGIHRRQIEHICAALRSRPGN